MLKVSPRHGPVHMAEGWLGSCLLALDDSREAYPGSGNWLLRPPAALRRVRFDTKRSTWATGSAAHRTSKHAFPHTPLSLRSSRMMRKHASGFEWNAPHMQKCSSSGQPARVFDLPLVSSVLRHQEKNAIHQDGSSKLCYSESAIRALVTVSP